MDKKQEREASTEPSAGYGPVHVVGDLVRNLLTLDQAAPIFAAFHVDYQGERRCRTRPISTSWERVIDGKWVDRARTDVPYAVIVWAKPEADEQAKAAGALTDDATDAARYRFMRSEATGDFLRFCPYGAPAEIDKAIDAAMSAHTKAGSGK